MLQWKQFSDDEISEHLDALEKYIFVPDAVFFKAFSVPREIIEQDKKLYYKLLGSFVLFLLTVALQFVRAEHLEVPLLFGLMSLFLLIE